MRVCPAGVINYESLLELRQVSTKAWEVVKVRSPCKPAHVLLLPQSFTFGFCLSGEAWGNPRGTRGVLLRNAH